MAEFFRDDLSQTPKIKITKDLLIASRIPRDYWECEIHKIPDNNYKQVLSAYIASLPSNDKEGRGLYLYGNYGSGKTGAGVAILKEAMRRGARAMFVAALELPDIFGYNNKEAVKLKDPILNTHFLLLDDLGAENCASWSTSWIETIVKLRNNNRLPTIITSNDSPVKTCERIGSIVSILGSRYKDINIKGIDWRLNPPKS